MFALKFLNKNTFDNYDDYVEGLKHDYVSQKTYVANFEMWGVEEITLNDIIGVTSVDLTEF